MTDVEIATNIDEVKRSIQLAVKEIPEVERDLTEEMMEEAVQEIRNSAKKRLNSFSGDLLQQIAMSNTTKTVTSDGTRMRLRLKGRTSSGVDYIAWHEFADGGQWVPVEEDNKPIQEWVDQNYRFDEDPDFIKVEPTSFVQPVLPKITKRIENRVENGNNALSEFTEKYSS